MRDCAYGNDPKNYEALCKCLISRVLELLELHKLPAFPVPKYGRGLELLRLFQKSGVEGPFFRGDHFLHELHQMPQYQLWLKNDTNRLQTPVFPYSGKENRGILFLSDPQLRSPASREAVRCILVSGGKTIMTGTVEKGSYSEKLLEAGLMELLRYPVHLNRQQMDAPADANAFSRIIPYHSPEITVDRCTS